MPWIQSRTYYEVQYRMDSGEWEDYSRSDEESARFIIQELRNAGITVRLAKVSVTIEPVEI